MTKIKVAVAGCLGRMGQEISKQILLNRKLEFVGGFEYKKHKYINMAFNKVSEINSTKIVESNPTRLINDAHVVISLPVVLFLQKKLREVNY